MRTLVWAGCALVAAFAAIGATDDLHRHVPLFLSLYGAALVAYAIAVRSVLRSPRATRRALVAMAVVAVAA
ncbi:MAG TPA: hypothetical protein VI565_05010, partial [Burkholderiales bacterium]|nr:hypothetical protein [Burkholderiales bacterium]